MNLNDTDIKKTVDSTVHSAYVVGRKRMASFISSSFTSKDSNTSLVEQQITQFLDQLYNSWTGKVCILKCQQNKEHTVVHSSLQKTIISVPPTTARSGLEYPHRIVAAC